MSAAPTSTDDDAARKRLHAGLLMLAGRSPVEAARAVGVARQTAYKWKARLDDGGLDALRQMANGRPAQLDAGQLHALRAALLKGARAHGFGSDTWTPKRARMLIERLHSVSYSEAHVRRLLAAAGAGGSPPPARRYAGGAPAPAYETRW